MFLLTANTVSYHHESPSLSTLASDNGLNDPKAVFRRLNGDDLATSFTNLVSYRSVILEIRTLEV